jgi:hypothetical protein
MQTNKNKPNLTASKEDVDIAVKNINGNGIRITNTLPAELCDQPKDICLYGSYEAPEKSLKK